VSAELPVEGMRRVRWWAAASVLGTVACGGGSPSGPPAATVTIRNSAYQPATVTIRKGETVAWVWQDGAIPHNVDGASDLSSFDSGSLVTAGTWRYRFTKTGTFTYHCDLHPGMQGIVMVQTAP
jgi:plastocyanin